MSRGRSLVLVFGALLVPCFARAAEPDKFACVAANDAAQELRRAGKLHEATEKLVLCGSMSCPAVVRQDCAVRLAEVDRSTPTVVFEARDSAGNPLVAVTVMMDGQRLTDKLDGQAVQVDPGEHRVAFEAAGLPSTEQTIVVREGERDRHEGVVLGRQTSTPRSAASPSDASPQRTIALVLGGAGVVGLVVGSVLGLVSKATYDHALQTECGSNPNGGCSPQGIQDGKTAHGQAAASTAMFVAGSVLLGAGAVLWITAPRGDVRVGATVGSDRAGLVVVGGW